ncbi:MAG: carboxypeptidase regulatory-like domain-containing protein [Gammaproteobacteria bacterium]|nr:carboxypeptidase regulatory-like domain-containing protein [Gammaproteobacteria bacterium]
MSATTTIHPNFVSNQLLTSTQLNQLFEYLDEQDRLSRIKLTGSGIICGLGWQISATATIDVNEGFGLSSDGYLISLAENTYTHFKDYIDPDVDDPDAEISSPLYTAWKKTGSLKGQVEGILQLETSAHDDNSELTADTLKDKILVIYLERKAVDLTSCLVTDCDNKGSNIHFTPRVLLVPQEVLKPVDVCPAAPLPLRVPRLHTQVELSNVNNAIDINQAYYKIASKFKTPLFNAINEALESYAVFVDLEDDWSWLDKLPEWYEQVNVGSEVNQYYYEITKVLVRASNELTETACHLLTECSAKQDFPRHLMLGHLDGDSNYRNVFTASPLQNVAQGDLQAVRLLFSRIRALVQNLPGHGLLLDSKKAIPDLRLIPSNAESQPLGETALPWYYAESETVRETWQPASCCTMAPLWSYAEPNDIDLDYNQASLLRIDGHIGLVCDEAVSKLEELKIIHNAEFCVLPLNLTDNSYTELTELYDGILEIELELLARQREFRIAYIVALQDGKISKKRREELAEMKSSIQDLSDRQYTIYEEWSELHCKLDLLCNPAELESDYRNLRCHLKGLLAAVKSALLEFSVFDDLKIEEIVPGLFDYLKFRVGEMLVEISELLKLLPPQLCAFSFPLFLSRYQALIDDLIEYQFLLPLLAQEITRNIDKLDVEVIIVSTTEFIVGLEDNIQRQLETCLQAISDNTFSCVGGVYYHYEAIRLVNRPWFKQFAGAHPGMESLFSVAKGGSFILVCDEDDRVVADLALSNCISCCCEMPQQPVCQPPVARPDFVSVMLVADEKREDAGYESVNLNIDVLKNDYSLLDDEESELDISLAEKVSELGGDISIKDGKVVYKLDDPLPGLVDRFSYLLKEESESCGDTSTGHVSIFFAPPVESEVGNITGQTRLEDGDFEGPIKGAKIAIIETGDSTFSVINDQKIAYFEFLDLPYATYTLLATNEEGFASERVPIRVDGTNPPVILKLLKKGTASQLGKITGFTVVEGSRITDAEVTIDETGQTTRSSITDKGAFEFTDLPFATYTLVATHKDGFASKPLTVVVDGTNPSVPLELLRKVTVPDVDFQNWVATVSTDGPWVARVTEATGTRAPQARNQLINVLSERRNEQLAALAKAESSDSVSSSAAYELAKKFIENSVVATANSDTALQKEYTEVSSELNKAIEAAPRQEQQQYRDLLKNASLGYMDRLYFSGTGDVTTATRKRLKLIGSQLEQSGLPVETVTEEWGGRFRDELKLTSVEDMMKVMR